MSSGLYSGVSGLALGTGLYQGNPGLWSGESGLQQSGSTPGSGSSLYLDFLTMTAPTFDSRITFSRGSNATLTDSTGKITYAPANLLQQSQSIASAPWSGDTSGGSIPTATNNAGTAPDGTNTATRLQINRGAGVFSRWQQTIAASTTALHIASVWMRTYSGTGTANVGLRNGADPGVNCVVTGTWQRFWVLNTAATNLPNIQILSWTSIAGTDVSADILVWGAQLEPVTYQTTPGVYQATTSSAYYGPRFDYDPSSLAAKGLLIEEQRTNLVTYSNTFSNAVWIKENISLSQNTTSPEGTANSGWTLTNDSTNAQHRMYFDYGSLSTARSIYAKAGTASFISLSCSGTDGVVFDLSNGTVVNSYTSATGTITAAGGGWYRLAVSPSSAYRYLIICIGETAAQAIPGTSYAGTGKTILVYGAQFENTGSFATSYIPTVASTVTRSADVATMTGTNFSSWYNQTAGTFVVGADKLSASARGVVVCAGNISVGFGTDISIDGQDNGYIRAYIENSGSIEMLNGTLATYTANVSFKSAIAYASNDAVGAANGNLGSVDTSVNVPTLNNLQIGANRNTTNPADNYLNGHIRTLTYYNTRLPNSTLVSLTS